jgi:ABC-type bacteriocin/lantibiotic exporter with double-glycine peptidase domain
MNKRKLLAKRFLLYLVIVACLTSYFWILLWIGLAINPFIALATLFLTFTIRIYYMNKLRDSLTEIL